MEKFVQSYECGITPNPCIDCNRYLKFEKLLHRAQVLGFDYVATGHYARVEQYEVTGRYLLKKALDASKDQSYVLYTMTQEQLAHTLFPLGTLTRQEVRSIAQQHSFVTAHKHDSQDICFVPGGEYAEFIKQYTGKAYPPGDFIDRYGNVLGTHRGIIHYTIGQRRGLSNAPVLRPRCVETTAMGVAYLAGLAVGYWNSKEDIANNWSIDRTFEPIITEQERHSRICGWKKAVKRSFHWEAEEYISF